MDIIINNKNDIISQLLVDIRVFVKENENSQWDIKKYIINFLSCGIFKLHDYKYSPYILI